jgi:tetratricopeptide (TPR) repeat protein
MAEITLTLAEASKRALALHQAGDLTQAEQIYRKIVGAKPNHFDALHLLGVLRYQCGHPDEADRLIKQALTIKPDDAAALCNRGVALHDLKRFDEALASYDKAIALKPDYADAYNNRGNALQELKRHQEALASYDQAIALKPDYAEAFYNRGNALQELKRHQEALASYDQAIALKPDYAKAHNNRGNALQELKRHEEALASYDQAIALKPDYADAYNNRGNALQELKRHQEALASYDQAIALKPDYAEAHNNRGVALHHLKRFDEAVASYDQAIALKPDYAEAFYNRGNALKDLKRFDEALASYDKAIALKPDYADAFYNRGNALKDLKRFDEALASYDKAIALKPDYADAYFNQSVCLLLMGRYEQGWRQYEWRKKKAEPIGVRLYSQPLWLGKENITGKTLFIYWEQGLGDTIQFCRYGKLIKALGAKVVVSVQEPLHQLLNQMRPDIQIINHNEVPTAFDYHCPLMSLPLALGTTLETIPSEQRYILADEQLRILWDARLPPRTKPRIGVVWSGHPKHKNDHNRSIDLPTLVPLFSADAHWISLQKELRDGDSASLRVLRQIVFYGDELRNFSDTAAVIDLLDLVITIDTSVAHLAGAMGKQVWILLPYIPDWRWLLDRSDSPWYPTARLFRQDDTRSWENVVERVFAALCDFVQSRS